MNMAEIREEQSPFRSLVESGKYLRQQLAGEHKEKRDFEAACGSEDR